MNNKQLINLGLLACVLGICVIIFQDFGVSTDEYVQHEYGGYVLDYYFSLGEVKIATNYANLYLYGGLFDMSVVAITRLFATDPYEIRHFLTAFVSIFGLIAVYKLTIIFSTPQAGLFAAILLFIEPFYFGNSFINPKDIPLAVAYAWTVYYLLLLFADAKLIDVWIQIKLGIALGIALSVRVGAAILVLFIVLALLQLLLFSSKNTQNFKQKAFDVIKAAAIIFVPAYAIMIFFWPYAHQNPIVNPLNAVLSFSDFDVSFPLLIAGQSYPANSPRWFYLPVYFLVKTSPIFLILTVSGCIVLLGKCFAGNQLVLAKKTDRTMNFAQRRGGDIYNRQLSCLMLAIVSIPLYIIISGATVYDTYRHILFVVPLLAVLAGTFVESILTLIVHSTTKFNKTYIKAALIVCLFASQAFALITLHPYQYAYYNVFVGGLSGAQNDYETDYWAISNKSALDMAINYLREKDGNDFYSNDYVISIGFGTDHFTYQTPENITIVYNDFSEADLGVSVSRWGRDASFDGDVVGVVERQGVVLNVIKDLR